MTTLRGDVLSRPYAIVDFGKEVGGDVTRRARRSSSGSPKVSFAFIESKQFMTSASDYSADPVGVVTETETVKVPNGTSTISPPDGRGGFRYLMVWLSGPGAVELSDLKLRFEAAPLQETCATTPAPSSAPTTSSTASGTPAPTPSSCRRSTRRPAAATRRSPVRRTTTRESATAPR